MSASAFTPFATASQSCWNRKPRSSSFNPGTFQASLSPKQAYPLVEIAQFSRNNPLIEAVKRTPPPSLRKLLQCRDITHITFVEKSAVRHPFCRAKLQLMRQIGRAHV